jgi:ubiquinone/menaquinone biosynthesis C-methylase UbiE
MNLEAVDQQTHFLVAAGHRVLQIHRFAASEREHVARLERWADFPPSAMVIDLGSGTGEVARIFNVLRPDLTFCLVNISQVQLAYSPASMKQHCCDFRSVPEPDGSFDAAMFCFSIGHADLSEALREAARLLRPGGILFIYDMARVNGDNSSMACVEYEVHARDTVEQAARAAGFSRDFYMEPHDDGEYARAVIGDAYEQVFAGTIPAIWRFVR